MDSFTTKQQAFIDAYLGDARYIARDAARAAKYKHPESSARQLMGRGHKVRKEIEERISEKIPADDELLLEMVKIAMADIGDDNVSTRDKRQAIKDLMELRGKLIHKHEVTTPEGLREMFGLSGEDSKDDDEDDE